MSEMIGMSTQFMPIVSGGQDITFSSDIDSTAKERLNTGENGLENDFESALINALQKNLISEEDLKKLIPSFEGEGFSFEIFSLFNKLQVNDDKAAVHEISDYQENGQNTATFNIAEYMKLLSNPTIKSGLDELNKVSTTELSDEMDLEIPIVQDADKEETNSFSYVNYEKSVYYNPLNNDVDLPVYFDKSIDENNQKVSLVQGRQDFVRGEPILSDNKNTNNLNHDYSSEISLYENATEDVIAFDERIRVLKSSQSKGQAFTLDKSLDAEQKSESVSDGVINKTDKTSDFMQNLGLKINDSARELELLRVKDTSNDKADLNQELNLKGESTENGKEDFSDIVLKNESGIKTTDYSSSVSQLEKFVIGNKEVIISPKEVIRQVETALKPVLSNLPQETSTEVVVELNPADLGKVVVEVISRAGKLSVKLIAEEESTAQILAQRSQNLQEIFKAQDLQLENYQLVSPKTQYQAQDYNGSAKNPYQNQHQNQQNDDIDYDFEELIAKM
ncbi:MAG: hypothetical protein GX346_05310 [Clostridiales bacterium]|nr:hypothetical protein [Clostridiales bacterium]